MWGCQRSVLVGRLLKGNEVKKVDNADLSQLSDYAVEVLYQFFFKGNQIIKSFFTYNWKTHGTVIYMRNKI